MSPMWLTSKTPTLLRTVLCSAISPPLDGYSTGMSQPPKLTILAPRRRCNAFSGVLRSSLLCGVAADSIPVAQAEIDTSTRSPTGQRSPPEGLVQSSRLPEKLRRLKGIRQIELHLRRSQPHQTIGSTPRQSQRVDERILVTCIPYGISYRKRNKVARRSATLTFRTWFY